VCLLIFTHAHARLTHQAERNEWICAISGAVDRAKENLQVSRTSPIDHVRSKLALVNNSELPGKDTGGARCGRKRLEGLLFRVDFVAQQDSDLCECVTAQMFVAVLLVVNFAVNIAETEISNMDVEMSNAFDIVDHCFTIFYVLELLLNLFVNWFWPFVNNGWSVFDALAVARV
jgi:hypothetical protein